MYNYYQFQLWKINNLIMKTIYITTSLLFLFFTGILQWKIFDIPWQIFSATQAVHVVASIVFFIFLIIPYVNQHVYKYRKQIVAKRRNSGNGMLLGMVLLALTITGVYLFLVGNRGGDDLGTYSYNIHLYGSFALMFLLWYHMSLSSANINRKRIAKQQREVKLKGLVYASALLGLVIPTLSYSSVSSSSLYLSKDTKFIYSANLDGGSISKIDATTGKKVFEKVLGGDIRRIAFNADESICGVTNYTQNKLMFLNDANRVVKEIKTKNKPHAIIFDEKNNQFFVTVFEDSELLVIDAKTLEITSTIKTFETPRGMALTDDGRLLITHAMIGMVSIYDSRSFARLKTITLHVTQNEDEFVSQGLPRLLDAIKIKPDGTEAWLPHVLWNFDHPFQFQSTIFPTVSVISLKKGFEKELDKKRKHLFKSINVVDNANKTLIVSNPWDLAFSADGAKAFVTLAGSEDIMTFNIGRSSGHAKKRRHRKRAKRSGKGAKVTQILRSYPNNTNPRALITHPKNNNVYVQNAARLDMTLLDSGGSHPFARMTLKKDKFAKLVHDDPMAKDKRLGKILFNNGNSDIDKNTPIVGDFWMSCNSCHYEGFNFTNGYLFEDTKLNKAKKANIGHDNIKNFLAAKPLENYVRIARDTQGGMGTDEKAEIEKIDPENMPKELEKRMQNLHEYVTANENLRYLSTWIKLEENVQNYHVEDWTNSAKCKSCHSDIFDQWADSNHKNLVGTNPYYMVLETLAGETEGEEFRQWCMGCHNPNGVTTGLKKTTDKMGHFLDKGAKDLIDSLKEHKNSELEEGVSCVTCHRITKIEDAGGNAAYTLAAQIRDKYAFEDSTSDVGQWMSEKLINSNPSRHADSYMKPVYKDSVYCASCHDEFSPAAGTKIVSTFKEWENSQFNNPGDDSKHKTCIDCHMTYMKDDKFAPLKGHSTDGGKEKDDVKVHYFAGSNHFLSGLKNQTNEDQTIQLLRMAAEIDIDIKDAKVMASVKNVGAGHHLPTGVADFRELWLDITVKDRDGNIVFESGKLKDDGNLGEDARPFMKVFGNEDGTKSGLLFWKFQKLLSDTRIPAGQTRVETFTIKDSTKLHYPLSATVKLNFRIYPQWVTDAVKKKYPQLPNPPVIELEKITKQFEEK